MPRNDSVTGSGGHGSGSQSQQQQQQQHTEEESTELSRAQLESKGCNSPLCLAQSSTAKAFFPLMDGSRESFITSSQTQDTFLQQSARDKSGKQHLQLKQHRPSVLRRGNQALAHAPSTLSGLSPCDPGAACKAEPDRNSPRSADFSPQNTTPYTRPMAPRPSHRPSGPEHSPSSSHLQSVQQSSLFAKGLCRWPGCNEGFKEYSHFLKHLHTEHGPGDKSIAQWRVQRDMVQHMENQLTVEKQKLLAMQLHLHLFEVGHTGEDESLEGSSSSSVSYPQCRVNGGIHSATAGSPELLTKRYWHIPTSHLIPGVVPSIECYKYTNIRPPYTYASMISWAILESPEKQLTLNEIYHWFTRMFFYFGHNTATWKNAVRHNLSLHKCFVRVEGGKGSVWTVDETEFLRKKGQKFHRDQDVNWMAPYTFFCPQY